MIKRILAIVLVTTGILAGAVGTGAQQQCSSPDDWLTLKEHVFSVAEIERSATFSSLSPACQEFFMEGLTLAPGHTVEKTSSQETTEVVAADSENSLAARTCRTTTYTQTKHTAFGFVAYKFHAHFYRCFDGSRVYSPSMWTTFSQVDHFMQIQSYISQNDYWNPYAWKFDGYEQRQVRNCIWSGCIGTYYPTASGWMTGSGSVYGSVNAG